MTNVVQSVDGGREGKAERDRVAVIVNYNMLYYSMLHKLMS